MELETTRIFVKVVQHESFSRAAELLKLPKSTVSRAVSGLEKETGTRLLVRTTRSLTLTSAGRAFYDTALGPVQILEDAHKSLFGQDSMLTGPVRITAPEDLGSQVVAGAMGKLAKENPGLCFELIYTDEVLDLVKDNFDLAVRIGKLPPSSYRARKLGDVELGLVASPAYLKQAGKISGPRDLAAHDCLSYLSPSSQAVWELRSGKESARVPVRPRMISNQMTSLVKMALAGSGIAFVPLHLVKPELEAGRLVRVLPQWVSASLPCSLVSPLALGSSARLRICADRIAAAVSAALE